MDVEKFVEQYHAKSNYLEMHWDNVVEMVNAALAQDRKEREVLPDDMPGTKARTDAIELADPLSAKLERLAEKKYNIPIKHQYWDEDGRGLICCDLRNIHYMKLEQRAPIAAVDAALEEAES